MGRIYNVVRDTDDERDYRLELEYEKATTLPTSVDLRSLCPVVYDQGQEGSCTANAGVAARVMLLGISSLLLSRAFLYYESRKLEGTTNSDSGAALRDMCRAAQSYGICEEKYMPYATTSYRTAPTTTAIKNAIKYKIKSYTRLSTMADIKNMVALNKKPVVIGMDVFESMESDVVAKTGKLPMPATNEQLLGGHAVLIVGYVDTAPTATNSSKGYFIVRNSWGENWGDKGYFYMPYEYFTQYTFDYWIFS